MIIDVYYDNEVHLYWDSEPEADGYTLYRKTDDHLFTSFKDVNTNRVALFGMTDGDEIKIKPFKWVGDKKDFCFKPQKIVLGQTITFDNFVTAVNIDKSSANIAWFPIKDANLYKIYKGDVLAGESKTNEYKAINLPATENIIRIEAYNNENLITQSEPIPVIIKDMEVFGINYSGQVLLYWNEVPNMDGYRILKKTAEREYTGFQSSKTTDAIISSAEFSPNEICEFKVRPYRDKDGNREYLNPSAKCTIKIYETQEITVTLVEAFKNQMAISWNFDGEVDGYDIFKNNDLLANIDDGLAHIYMTEMTDAGITVKGYKWHLGQKLYTCESKKITYSNTRDFTPDSYKLSVIIPAYNSQEYISRTICTVLASTLDDIELLLVDDGSSDNTRDVINWYQEKYPAFIRGIFKQNGGVADTRNRGIQEATGKYIAFMDNDDMIRPNGFKKLYDEIEATGSDIAVSPIYRIDNDRYVIRHKLPFEENKAYEIEDYLKLIFSPNYSNIGVWNKLYKSELVKAHPFGKLAYEDVSWTPHILSYADKFCYLDEVCYEWDRKIRPATFSNVLSNRSAEEKFKERYEAFLFFYEGGNQAHHECLAYLMAKRLFGQGTTAKYEGYFDAIRNMKSELINNKFLLEDEYYSSKILPLLE